MTPESDADTIEMLARAYSAAFSRSAGTPDPGPSPYDYMMAETALAFIQPRLDLLTVLEHHIAFSFRTFGPGERLKGTLDHVKKELKEIEAKPHDCEEWVDLMLLAINGAARHGHNAEAIAGTWLQKMAKNDARDWPDWRTADPDKAIEHVRR